MAGGGTLVNNTRLLQGLKRGIGRGLKRLDSCNAILPERCSLCLRPDAHGYCHDCQTLLPWIDIACQRCARPLIEPGVCGQCQGTLVYRHILVPFHYQNPVSAHIHALKYQDRLSLAAPLAKMLAQRIVCGAEPLPEVLLPVPLHPARLRQRGYNQAAIIAGALGALLGLPVDRRFLVRCRDTPSQTDLDEDARRRNMRGAFAVAGEHRYRSVAVIDDVVTSGATVASICASIHRSGCVNISVYAIAKT